MLKRFKQLKKGFQKMVISDQWSSYKEDDVGNTKFGKDTLLDNNWWDKVDYVDVPRRTNMKVSSLNLLYGMWGSTIEKVKKVIYD